MLSLRTSEYLQTDSMLSLRRKKFLKQRKLRLKSLSKNRRKKSLLRTSLKRF